MNFPQPTPAFSDDPAEKQRVVEELHAHTSLADIPNVALPAWFVELVTANVTA